MEPAVYINPPRADWPALLQRPVFNHASLERAVRAVLMDVQQEGDKALRHYTRMFDGVEPANLLVSDAEFELAAAQISTELKSAIALASDNIRAFHATQRSHEAEVQVTGGVTCWRASVPVQKVGLYIPGGTAPLFSTLLMLGIPAQLAGCDEIVVCTPPGKDGTVHPAVLYAAQSIGIRSVFKAGGVQAIAAMAYGTGTVPQVYKIFGPGNQYVTCAKQLLSRDGVAIDLPAGPSEVAVYADASCEPAFVAADLLSQAEHGADSQVLLVTTAAEILPPLMKALQQQLDQLPRKAIAEQVLSYSRFLVMDEEDTAFSFLNDYAPEHLIIASADARRLASRVINAGSVFLGNYAPESAGDYASGTNHTLPTNGWARAYSGVSLDSFVKKITFQEITPQGLRKIGPAVEAMAAAEGLQAHKNAVSIRLKNLE